VLPLGRGATDAGLGNPIRAIASQLGSQKPREPVTFTIRNEKVHCPVLEGGLLALQ
jgi:hypothetical protein